MPVGKHMVRQYGNKGGSMKVAMPAGPSAGRKTMSMTKAEPMSRRVKQFGGGKR